MKAIFGVLSLLIALAIVAVIAKGQLRAAGDLSARHDLAASDAAAQLAEPGSRTSPAAPGQGNGAAPADPNGATVADQARSMQQQARDGAVRALQQATERNERADP